MAIKPQNLHLSEYLRGILFLQRPGYADKLHQVGCLVRRWTKNPTLWRVFHCPPLNNVKRKPLSPGGWAFSLKFSSACEERCRDETTVLLKGSKPSTWQLSKPPVLTASIWVALVCVGVCWEAGVLAGASDGVEDSAGCHYSLQRVPLKWRNGLKHPPSPLRVHFDLWFVMCTLLQLILHVLCALLLKMAAVDWSERMADAAKGPALHTGKKDFINKQDGFLKNFKSCQVYYLVRICLTLDIRHTQRWEVAKYIYSSTVTFEVLPFYTFE